MAEDRNFRSYYYDKVGFRGVEEKRSLDFLLKDKPLNIPKLRQFCLRFFLPCTYREYVWKVLLGVLPCNPESHESWRGRQREQYAELRRSLEIMQLVDKSTPVPEVITLMLFMEEGNLLLSRERQLEEAYSQNALSIASAFTRMASDVESAYFLTQGFLRVLRKFFPAIGKLKEKLETTLDQEDAELSQHLRNSFTFRTLPLDTWFARCFAEILPENALERIWDKIIGGSCHILVFVGVALFTTLRRTLLNINTPSDMHLLLKKIPEETADRVVNKALEMWQTNCAGQSR